MTALNNYHLWVDNWSARYKVRQKDISWHLPTTPIHARWIMRRLNYFKNLRNVLQNFANLWIIHDFVYETKTIKRKIQYAVHVWGIARVLYRTDAVDNVNLHYLSKIIPTIYKFAI